MGYETLIVEKEDKVAIIKLNRLPVNPLNGKLYNELFDAISELDNDAGIGAIIITGNGEKAFAAGLDIKEVMGKSIVEVRDFTEKVSRRALSKLTGIEKPTIAAVFGLALGGGCEVALCCDMRIVSEDAVFGLPEITLGIMPGSGATQRLARLIGVPRAKEMLFTGDNVNAQEAYRIGLANKVVPKDKLMEEAKAMAKKLASRPKVALGLIKKCVDSGLDVDIETGLTMEINSFVIAFASEDGREGISAFNEKRKPNYKGK
jgi:enoyl-CoA hydratase